MLFDELKEDLKSAMKERREFDLGVLRLLLSAIQNGAIEKKTKGLEGDLTDDEILLILGREAKKRKEAARMFADGKRDDLAEKELKEAESIEKYLPAQLERAEIESIVKKIIGSVQDSGAKDFGSVMKEAMKELKGKADGRTVGEIIRKELGQ